MNTVLKLMFAFGLPAVVIVLCLRYPDVLLRVLAGLSGN